MGQENGSMKNLRSVSSEFFVAVFVKTLTALQINKKRYSLSQCTGMVIRRGYYS